MYAAQLIYQSSNTDYYQIYKNNELQGVVLVKDNACTMSCMTSDLCNYVFFNISWIKAVIESW
jgi:hypothetical protein